MAVLSRPDVQLDVSVGDHQVTIRRRNHDLTSAQDVPIDRGSARQRPDTVEDAGKRARAPGCEMEYHAHGGREIGRQAADHPPQCLHTSG
jgi:hypothetical protein